MSKQVRVCIVSNSDPVDPVPGGIDAFVGGIIRNGPSDIRFQLLGVTTDSAARPVRQWTECSVDGNPVDFFPVLALDDPGKRHRIPISLRSTLSMMLRPPKLQTDVLEFHRFELMFPFVKSQARKTAFVHQNMQVLKGSVSDMRWKYAPKLYFWFEDRVVPHLDSLYAVREDAAEDYRQRYPKLAPRIQFCPTWYDPRKFSNLNAEDRDLAAREIRQEFGFHESMKVILSVGRLDHQKDPLLLLKAFAALRQKRPDTGLVFIGEGVLRPDVEAVVREQSLGEVVKLPGLRNPDQIARYHNGADVYCLSSVYEGMPISLLEALACGTPAVSTDAGEARRLIREDNGVLVKDRTSDGLATALDIVLHTSYEPEAVANSVADYTPSQVLKPIYDNYRELGLDLGD
ncbi:MAG: glycosyltransferase [Pseudomonadota bacterium]